MAELGLFGDGSPLPRRDRPFCDARTRKGARGWCPANDVVAYPLGAQEDLARFKAKGGSQQRNTDGGPRGELGNSG